MIPLGRANGRSGGIAVPVVLRRMSSDRRSRAGGSGGGPECRSGPGFRIGVKRKTDFDGSPSRRSLSPVVARSEGRRDRTCGLQTFGNANRVGWWKVGTAALRSDALLTDPTAGEGARGLVPTCRSWPPSLGKSAARKGAASRPGDRKCDTWCPAALVKHAAGSGLAARSLSPGKSGRNVESDGGPAAMPGLFSYVRPVSNPDPALSEGDEAGGRADTP